MNIVYISPGKNSNDTCLHVDVLIIVKHFIIFLVFSFSFSN